MMMSQHSASFDTGNLERVPVFPLPRLVFFPDTLLPLHVFEARYREMVAWCIEHQSPLAITRIRPGFEGDQLGDPPMDSVATIGRITEHVHLPDGRSNLILKGLHRVRVEAELEHDAPFRLIRATRLESTRPDPATAQAYIQQLRAFIHGISSVNAKASELLGRALLDGGAERIDILSDRLASMLFNDPDDKQGLLEELDASIRMERCLDRLASVLVHLTDTDADPN